MKIVNLFLCLFIFVFNVAAQETLAERSSLKPISVNGKMGFADKSGKVIIQPQFDEVHSFSEGLAAVAIGTDPNAKSVITGGSGNTLYTIFVDRDDLWWGFIDETGEFIIPPQFKLAEDFSEGFASISLAKWGKWGYIDKLGIVIIQPQFSYHTKFVNGRAKVSIGGFQQCEKPNLKNVVYQYGYVDRKGKFTEVTCEEWYSEGAG